MPTPKKIVPKPLDLVKLRKEQRRTAALLLQTSGISPRITPRKPLVPPDYIYYHICSRFHPGADDVSSYHSHHHHGHRGPDAFLTYTAQRKKHRPILYPTMHNFPEGGAVQVPYTSPKLGTHRRKRHGSGGFHTYSAESTQSSFSRGFDSDQLAGDQGVTSNSSQYKKTPDDYLNGLLPPINETNKITGWLQVAEEECSPIEPVKRISIVADIVLPPFNSRATDYTSLDAASPNKMAPSAMDHHSEGRSVINDLNTAFREGTDYANGDTKPNGLSRERSRTFHLSRQNTKASFSRECTRQNTLMSTLSRRSTSFIIRGRSSSYIRISSFEDPTGTTTRESTFHSVKGLSYRQTTDLSISTVHSHNSVKPSAEPSDHLSKENTDATTKSTLSSRPNSAPEVREDDLMDILPPNTVFPDGSKEAYLRALGAAQIKYHPHDYWDLSWRISRPWVFSYFELVPRLAKNAQPPAKPSTVKNGMKHIFGDIDVNDYFPGGKRNRLKHRQVSNIEK